MDGASGDCVGVFCALAYFLAISGMPEALN